MSRTTRLPLLTTGGVTLGVMASLLFVRPLLAISGQYEYVQTLSDPKLDPGKKMALANAVIAANGSLLQSRGGTKVSTKSDFYVEFLIDQPKDDDGEFTTAKIEVAVFAELVSSPPFPGLYLLQAVHFCMRQQGDHGNQDLLEFISKLRLVKSLYLYLDINHEPGFGGLAARNIAVDIKKNSPAEKQHPKTLLQMVRKDLRRQRIIHHYGPKIIYELRFGKATPTPSRSSSISTLSDEKGND